MYDIVNFRFDDLILYSRWLDPSTRWFPGAIPLTPTLGITPFRVKVGVMPFPLVAARRAAVPDAVLEAVGPTISSGVPRGLGVIATAAGAAATNTAASAATDDACIAAVGEGSDDREEAGAICVARR